MIEFSVGVIAVNGEWVPVRIKENGIIERLDIERMYIPKFGGDSSKIIEAPTFSRNKDGTISYRIVGERIIPAQKSVTIGVGNTQTFS